MTAFKPAPLPGQPCDRDGPVFSEAWEAQAFAMTIALHERGVFTWTEWASALAAEIRAAQAAGDPDLGSTYYAHWLAALERLIVEKDVASPGLIDETAQAWEAAARATPHGQPIVLEGRPRAAAAVTRPGD